VEHPLLPHVATLPVLLLTAVALAGRASPKLDALAAQAQGAGNLQVMLEHYLEPGHRA
jgi:hypothetical protein